MPAPQVVAVGAVVLDRSGRALLVLRGRSPGAGTWSLPGGKVEGRESLAQAAAREVFEETGVLARVVAPLGVVPVAREGFSYAIYEHLLVETGANGGPCAGDDARDARWAGAAELEALEVADDVRALIREGLELARALGLVA